LPVPARLGSREERKRARQAASPKRSDEAYGLPIQNPPDNVRKWNSFAVGVPYQCVKLSIGRVDAERMAAFNSLCLQSHQSAIGQLQA
jgi:hypothetical protein